VYVLRNPKDCMNSLHFFQGEPKDGWKGNEYGLGTLERFLSGANAYGSFFHHVLSMSEFIDTSCADRACVVYYEDFESDIKSNVRKLAEFLNVDMSEEKLKAICQVTSFDAMKNGSAGDMVSKSLCRKGVCRDWVNAPLTEEDWLRFDEIFQDRLGTCPLAHPLRAWMTSCCTEFTDSTDEFT